MVVATAVEVTKRGGLVVIFVDPMSIWFVLQ